jgi:hypothetical protein
MTFSTLTIAELRHRAAQLRLQAARIPTWHCVPKTENNREGYP